MHRLLTAAEIISFILQTITPSSPSPSSLVPLPTPTSPPSPSLSPSPSPSFSLPPSLQPILDAFEIFCFRGTPYLRSVTGSILQRQLFPSPSGSILQQEDDGGSDTPLPLSPSPHLVPCSLLQSFSLMLRPSLPPSSSLYFGSLFESIVSLAGGGVEGKEGGLDLALVGSVVKLIDEETANFRGRRGGELFEIGCRGLCYLSFLSRFICSQGRRDEGAGRQGEGEKGKGVLQGRVEHVGSKCRGCLVSPIVGVRYRCVSKVFFLFYSPHFLSSFPSQVQFDICEKCERSQPKFSSLNFIPILTSLPPPTFLLPLKPSPPPSSPPLPPLPPLVEAFLSQPLLPSSSPLFHDDEEEEWGEEEAEGGGGGVEEGGVHGSVICDGCSVGPVCGVRFKCLHCRLMIMIRMIMIIVITRQLMTLTFSFIYLICRDFDFCKTCFFNDKTGHSGSSPLLPLN